MVPIYKKDDPLNPMNYRPVTIVPVMSKIMEKVISRQIIKYLNDNALIHPSHHAYRAKHNTSTAMIEMVDSWVEALESG